MLRKQILYLVTDATDEERKSCDKILQRVMLLLIHVIISEEVQHRKYNVTMQH